MLLRRQQRGEIVVLEAGWISVLQQWFKFSKTNPVGGTCMSGNKIKKNTQECEKNMRGGFQLMRAVENPHEAILYLRRREERISFMFLFHLTLIPGKATRLHTPELQHRERLCVSVRVKWSGTSRTSLLSDPLSSHHSCTCARTPTPFNSEPLSSPRTGTGREKKNRLSHMLHVTRVSGGKEHCSGLSRPPPPPKLMPFITSRNTVCPRLLLKGARQVT